MPPGVYVRTAGRVVDDVGRAAAIPSATVSAASTALQGLVLGWSVAWPPGPINAEMIRRGLGGRFWSAWSVGLGACCADFLWALGVALGAGALAHVPGVTATLGVVSLGLLVALAAIYARGAWRAARHPAAAVAAPGRFDSARGGWLLGFGMALSSPWNLAFWLAVIGQHAGTPAAGLATSLLLASAVVLGATAWSLTLCTAVRLGARFATSWWQVATQAATALLMLVFALALARRLLAGG